MLRIDEIRVRLQDRNIAMIARDSNINKGAIYRVLQGRNINYPNHEALSRYFEEQEEMLKALAIKRPAD